MTQKLTKVLWIGFAREAELVESVAVPESEDSSSPATTLESEDKNTANVKKVTSEESDSSKKGALKELLAEVCPTLMTQDKETFVQLLSDVVHAFALEEGERGETDMIQMTIETGNSPPKRQPV